MKDQMYARGVLELARAHHTVKRRQCRKGALERLRIAGGKADQLLELCRELLAPRAHRFNVASGPGRVNVGSPVAWVGAVPDAGRLAGVGRAVRAGASLGESFSSMDKEMWRWLNERRAGAGLPGDASSRASSAGDSVRTSVKVSRGLSRMPLSLPGRASPALASVP